MEQERERSFGRGMMEGIGGIRSQGFGQAMRGAQAAGQGLGTMGRAFGDLGMTGQRGLMGQMGAFNQMGQTGRGIQDRMYGAQYGAAQQMAQEPWQRMGQWGNMMGGMMPQTGAVSKFGAAAGTDPLAAILALLQGGAFGGG